MSVPTIRRGRSGSADRGPLGVRFPTGPRQSAATSRRQRIAAVRGQIPADQGGLDRDRAAAAEGIDQRAIGPPEAQQDQRRGQRLLERRLADQGPIAAFVQPRPGGVDRQRRPVVQQGDFDTPFRPGFRELLHTVGGPQLLDNRLLDDFLAGRHAGELRSDRAPRDRKLVVDRNPFFPRQGVGGVEQHAKISGLEFAHPHQDAVGRAQPEIRPADGRFVACKQDPAGLNDLGRVAQGFQFPSHNGLQAERGRRDQIHRIRLPFCPVLRTASYTAVGRIVSMPLESLGTQRPRGTSIAFRRSRRLRSLSGEVSRPRRNGRPQVSFRRPGRETFGRSPCGVGRPAHNGRAGSGDPHTTGEGGDPRTTGERRATADRHDRFGVGPRGGDDGTCQRDGVHGRTDGRQGGRPSENLLRRLGPDRRRGGRARRPGPCGPTSGRRAAGQERAEPFQKDSLAQEVVWDSRDDAGQPAAGGPFSVRVRLGLRPKLENRPASGPTWTGPEASMPRPSRPYPAWGPQLVTRWPG